MKTFNFLILFLILFIKVGFAVEPLNIEYIVNTICLAESSNNPLAVGDHGKSRGLMQIKEATWKRYTKESWDKAFNPKSNRAIGTLIVKDIIKQYGDKATISKVIFSYNSGIIVKKSMPTKWTIKHPNKVYRKTHIKDQHNNVIK